MKMKNPYDAKYLKISLYALVTFLLAYSFTKLADQFGNILLSMQRLMGWTIMILRPLFYGVCIAYVLYPLVGFIAKQLAKRPFFEKRESKTRMYAVVVTMVGVGLFITMMISILVSAVNHEIQFVSFDDLNELLREISQGLYRFSELLDKYLASLNVSSGDFNTYLHALGASVVKWLRGYGMSVTDWLTNVFSFFTNMFFAIIFSIYILLDVESLSYYWDNVLRAFLPRQVYVRVKTIVRDADSVFAGYIRGQLIDAIFMMVTVSVSLSLINVRFGVMIGILTGIGNLIPYVGPFVAYGSTVVVCLVSGDLEKLFIAVAVLFAIQAIDGNIVNPKLLSSAIEVHPMFVIVCLIVGSAVGGVGGMLFAVPLGALVKIQFERLMLRVMISKTEAEMRKNDPPKGWQENQTK